VSDSGLPLRRLRAATEKKVVNLLEEKSAPPRQNPGYAHVSKKPLSVRHDSQKVGEQVSTVALDDITLFKGNELSKPLVIYRVVQKKCTKFNAPSFCNSLQ